MLTAAEAEKELILAGEMNPGLWTDHSRAVADNARRIAEKAPGMDPNRAHILGLMHDIGRRAGITGIAHIFDGYRHMISLGQPEIARICLTHSFPLPDVRLFAGKYDCSEEDLTFLADYLEGTSYDNYDILIQLCDAISLPTGACIVEKRLVDVALRNGLPAGILEKWKAFLAAKEYFDGRCGCNIYSLLPGVAENSLGSLPRRQP